MVEFLISRKIFTEVMKYGCVMKTPKSKGLIQTVDITLDNGQMIVKGIDNGAMVMSCVRTKIDAKENGNFVYTPKELINRITNFGEELHIRTDDEKIYVTDTSGETSFVDTLPSVDIDFPLEFRIFDEKILPQEDIEITHKTIVNATPPKLGKDIMLYFGPSGFSIGHEDELTKFQKKLGSEKFDTELKVKLDGNIFDKVTNVIGSEFILGANEDIVFVYSREEWGDFAYMISTLV